MLRVWFSNAVRGTFRDQTGNDFPAERQGRIKTVIGLFPGLFYAASTRFSADAVFDIRFIKEAQRTERPQSSFT